MNVKTIVIRAAKRYSGLYARFVALVRSSVSPAAANRSKATQTPPQRTTTSATGYSPVDSVNRGECKPENGRARQSTA